jgi:DNA modification methylase
MINIFRCDYLEHVRDMPDKSIDVIITDPPYEIALDMGELRRVCRGHIIAFCAPENKFFIPDEIAYWIKTPSTKNYTRHLGRFVEYIIIERHGDTFNTGLHWSNYTGVYNDMILEKQIHPFEKPLSLMERLILIFSNPGDIVFDPFMGSGKTGKACQHTNRSFVGVEEVEEYFQLACKEIGVAK